MAEKFRFFDPVMDENGNYDREYNAQEFVEYFSALVTTGVMKGAGNQLSVTADNASMVTTLDTGIAFILGRYYENDSVLTHIHDTETVGKERIDRIVIRMDNNAGSRFVKSFVKKGVASTAPIPPALTRDGEIYEISVAQVRIVGGQTFIRTENVVDERGVDIICPFAGSRILPNFDDAALQELQNKVDNMFSLTDGDNMKYYEGDLNNLTESGFYTSTGAEVSKNHPTNLATLYRPIIEVFKGADDWVYQRFSYSNNQGSHIFIRALVMGTWNVWTNLVRREQEEPINAYLVNGWKTSNGYPALKYYKDDFGVVHVSGVVTGGTSKNVCTIPVGYRPSGSHQVVTFPIFNTDTKSMLTGLLWLNTGFLEVSDIPTSNSHKLHIEFSYRARGE